MVSGLDGQSIRAPADLLFEPVRDGLLDLLLSELDEGTAGMDTPGANGPLPGGEINGCLGPHTPSSFRDSK
jgi:hypothetical protein